MGVCTDFCAQPVCGRITAPAAGSAAFFNNALRVMRIPFFDMAAFLFVLLETLAYSSISDCQGSNRTPAASTGFLRGKLLSTTPFGLNNEGKRNSAGSSEKLRATISVPELPERS